MENKIIISVTLTKRIEPIGSLSIIDNGAKGLSQLVQFTKVSPRVQLLIWLPLGTISVTPTKRIEPD